MNECVIRLPSLAIPVILLWFQTWIEADIMKFAGFLLLLAGWSIALTAVILLRAAVPRAAFVLAGVAIECVGMVLVARAHLMLGGEKE
jgi:hypothetical protein